ncbi:Calmodulin-like protein 3 [Linum perenne]
MTSVFATFDKNGDGLITKQELRESLKNIQISATEKEAEEMVVKVDSNGEELKEAFEVFDGDKDGLITVEELGSVLSSLGMKEGKKMEDCKEMIRRVDVDGDGMVNFDEFKTMMMRNGGRLLSSV